MLNWLKSLGKPKDPTGLCLHCEVTLKPDPEQPEIAGYFTHIGVWTLNEDDAIRQAKSHLSGPDVLNIQVDDIEPLTDDPARGPEGPHQIGGRAFFGHE